MDLSTDQILSEVPKDAGSYIDAATALEQPVTEKVINEGKHDLSGEHVMGHLGLEDLLEGKLHDELIRAIKKSDDPMLSSNQALAHVEKTVSKHSDSVSDAVKGVFSDKEVKASDETLEPTKHQEIAERFNHLNSNPSLLIDKLSNATELLQAFAPNIAQSVKDTAARAVSFLSSKAQMPAPEPFGEKYEPSQHESSLFHRYYSIVEDPERALSQIKEGTLTPEATETLQAVYPKLYDRMKSDLLSELKPETPYRTKLLISQFLQSPLDSSLSPETIASIQNTFTGGTPQAPKAPPKKISEKGAQKIDLAKRTSLNPEQEV